MKKVVAIIQARMGSTRLPGKVLMDIAGKPILWHVIERVKRCREIDAIVVATTNKDEDKAIVDMAKESGIEAYTGSETDVLDRYYQAAKKVNADVVIRITADCPLVNPTTIDEMIGICLNENVEYVCGYPNIPSIEEGMEVVSFPALEKVKSLGIDDYQKEHVTIFIRENPELFKIGAVKPQPIFRRTDMRITVDTEDDFKLMREIYDRLYEEDEIIDLKDVVKLLDDNAELKKINANVQISDVNKYSGSLKTNLSHSLKVENSNNKNKMTIVFRCDSSQDIGLGHVIRCLAVAKELQENNNVIFACMKDGTNSFVQNANFEMFLKEHEESEKAFLTRISMALKPDVIAIDKKYPYGSSFLSDLKNNKSKMKIVMIDNICEGMSAADEVIFPAAHLDKNLLRKYMSQEQIGHVKTGPEYVILRDEVLSLKDKVSHDMHTPPNIVVTTGGTDPEGVLLKLIPWLKEMNLDANVMLLVGQAFKFRDELDDLIGDLPNNFSVMPYSSQELIKGDVVICTFGVSIYEMIYLQIPIICISHSMENANGARILKERYGVIEDMGFVEDIGCDGLYTTISKLLVDKIYLMNIIEHCDELLDGNGVKRMGQIIAGGK